MTKLLEHQVKALLAADGLQVPPGRVVTDPSQARGAALEWGAVWLKAQVLAGDRAAVGGVVRAGTPEEAETVAARLLGSKVHGLPVREVLVEQSLDGEWQGYASVALAENPPRMVLRYSRQGGSGFDVSDAKVVVELNDARHPFAIRKALADAGVSSAEILPTTRFLYRMAGLARRWCAQTLELNPVLFREGEFVVLDAKADIDDYSRALIPDPRVLDNPAAEHREHEAHAFQSRDHRGSLRYVQLVAEDDGEHAPNPVVAVHAVGGGESLVLFDALADAGLSPSNYCDTSGSPSQEKVAFAAALVAGQPHVAGLLFSTCIANQDLVVTARGLVEGWAAVGWERPTVVRLAGNGAHEAGDIVSAWGREMGVPIRVLGEQHDEWQAAALLSKMLAETDQGER